MSFSSFAGGVATGIAATIGAIVFVGGLDKIMTDTPEPTKYKWALNIQLTNGAMDRLLFTTREACSDAVWPTAGRREVARVFSCYEIP